MSEQTKEGHGLEDKWIGLIKEIKKSVLTDFELEYCEACSGGGTLGVRMRDVNDMFLVISCPVKCNIISKICEYFIDVHCEVRYNAAKGLDAFPIILIKNESERAHECEVQ